MSVTAKLVRLGVFWLGLSSCAPIKYSPWQTDVDARNLTEQNLARLSENAGEQGLLGNDLGSFRIAVIGDPQGHPGDFQRTIQRINDIPDISFILVLGDLTDYGLKHEYEWAFDALKQSKVPYFTAVGNHDAISHGKQIYQKMFGAFDYSFTYGGIKLVIWNNNKNEFSSTNFEWLAANVDDKTVVASHIPPELDVHSESELGSWLSINRNAQIVSSLHGHRGTQKAFSWMRDEIPYFVVAKNKGSNYSLISYKDAKQVKVENCNQICASELE